MKNTKLALAVMMTFSSAASAADVVSVPEVAVTASPIIEENNIDNYSSTSTTVTQDQIRDLNALDLASALRNTPGVEISRFNPVGSYNGNQGGAVYIRGTGASRPGSEIKTYVDGVPVYMGVWGHPLLDLLPINAMDTITVYKSPQPQINGNNFASINLETRHVTEEGVHGGGNIAWGSFGTIVEQADLAGRGENVDFMLVAGHAQSDGQRAHADGDVKNIMGRVGVKINDIWSAGVSFLAVDNEVKDPGDNRLPAAAITPVDKSDTHMVTAFVAHQSETLKGEFRVYSNEGNNNLYNDTTWGTFLSKFSMRGIHWKEQYTPWTGGQITAGVDLDWTSGKVQGPYTGDVPPYFGPPSGGPIVGNVPLNMPSFQVTSPYLGVSQKITISEGWNLIPSIGIRDYEHSQYQSELAPYGGVSLVSDRITVFANASRGINYPGLEAPGIQTALPFLFANSPSWQHLSPETMDHKEIGAKLFPTDTTQVDLSLFHDNVQNRYVYDLSFGSGTFRNLGMYQTNGAELSVRQQIASNWKAFVGVTLLDSSLSTLPYAPTASLTAGVNGAVGPFRVVVDAQGQSKEYALTLDRNVLNPNAQQVGGFAVVNVRVAYPLPMLGKKGELFVAVENLFDRRYAYQPGYPMPGINGRVGLSASF